MHGGILTISSLAQSSSTSSAIDRLNAARNMSGSDSDWVWVLVIAFVLIGAAALLAVIINMKRGQAKAMRKSFEHEAERAGLSMDEVNLLRDITKVAALRNPNAIFVMASVFDQAISVYVRSGCLVTMTDQQRELTFTLLQTLREKLGFQKFLTHDSSSQVSSREISTGETISVVHRGKAEGIHAKVAGTDATSLTVQPEIPVQCRPGEAWLVRYSSGGAVWEFDAPVVKAEDGIITLAHTDYVRFINRRRFPRVSVHRRARIARFPFRAGRSLDELPEFLDSSLLEIAGPGLKLETPADVATGDKLLVIVELAGGQVVQGMGAVRRVDRHSGTTLEVAVELIGLAGSDIAELARQTNSAATSDDVAADLRMETAPA